MQHSSSRVTTSDIYLHGKQYPGWEHEFFQLSAGLFTGVASQVRLGPIQLFHDACNQAVEHRGHSWPGSRVFVSLLPGSSGSCWQGRRRTPQSLSTYTWDRGGRAHSTGPYQTVGFVIDDAWWNDYYLKATGQPLPGDFYKTISAIPASSVAVLQARMLQMIAQSRATQDRREESLDADLALDDMLGLLMRMIAERTPGWDNWSPPSTREYIVERAVDFIDENISRDISIVDICQMLRISPRTLEYSFRDLKGVTPVRYIQMRRLGAIRKALLEDPGVRQIKQHATSWGFSHLGRLSQAYRQLYGETPTQTRARGLAHVADEVGASAPGIAGIQ